MQIELTQELSKKLHDLAGVVEKSAHLASDDLSKLRDSLGAVVNSMDASTVTMAWLTRWLIAAAIVSSLAAIIQIVLTAVKG